MTTDARNAGVRTGFTMLEVMVAMSVLSMCLSGFVAALADAHAIQSRTMARSKVVEDLQKRIEDYQSRSYTDLVVDLNKYPGSYDIVSASGTRLIDPWPGQAHVVTVGMQQVGSVIKITITSRWRDENGNSQLDATYVHANRGGG